MKQSLKPKPKDPCEWLDDAPQKAKKWRNLYFLKCGKTISGPLRWPDEQTALKAAHDADDHARKDGRNPYICVENVRTGHSWSEISHVLQIPAAE